jgi:site-specific recombinase XerD
MNNQLIVRGERAPIPGQIAVAGEEARKRFIEFFTANICNRNTRAAYLRAVSDFFQWCEEAGLSELRALQPVHVAAYVESLGKTHSAPSVKQHLAAVRMLFDWLVVGQVVGSNPASVVRGPKHVVKRGKTPVLVPEEARALFESIPADTLVGLRDRALLAVLIYSFARISAALSMRVEDYFPQGKRWWLRLHGEGREISRDAGAPYARGVSGYLHPDGGNRRGQERAAVPECHPEDREALRATTGPR